MPQDFTSLAPAIDFKRKNRSGKRFDLQRILFPLSKRPIQHFQRLDVELFPLAGANREKLNAIRTCALHDRLWMFPSQRFDFPYNSTVFRMFLDIPVIAI